MLLVFLIGDMFSKQFLNPSAFGLST